MLSREVLSSLVDWAWQLYHAGKAQLASAHAQRNVMFGAEASSVEYWAEETHRRWLVWRFLKGELDKMPQPQENRNEQPTPVE